MSAARAATPPEPALGIIGGSGLYEMEGIEDLRWVGVRTPFGEPSDQFGTGRLGDRRVIFLPRHGRGHRLSPTEINYRANIWSLKSLGARWVVSVSAVGSMKEDIHPLDLVIPDQFYDHTRRRVSSFFGEGIVGHVGMADPVCPGLGDLLEAVGRWTQELFAYVAATPGAGYFAKVFSPDGYVNIHDQAVNRVNAFAASLGVSGAQPFGSRFPFP